MIFKVASKGIEPLPPDPNSGILSIELRSRGAKISINHEH